MIGIFSYHKPKGITSAQFLNKIKKDLNTKEKIGHGGTLDKFAEGVLVVAIGQEYTKQLTPILKNSTKEYEAEIKLGVNSTTCDSEGEMENISDKKPTLKEIKEVIKKFPLNKSFTQTSPLYSAKKIKGVRQSDLMRVSKIFEPKKSLVTLHSIEIQDYNYPILKIKITTSSGFYVRSLARDLGEKLQTGAYLINLKRTKIITENKIYK
ncbi:MAG: tRNA pseudouridine(55) synthase TruB [Candidatus Liptonbacteria bacterium CG11_big_fil_rev_8_21_14_0_20_35_14]|uniref:tRNA pseudouridine(55) synthase n=1 Tax=Candidatus Liptonbacteria bacterium CG11_big_fil_rev_8_21_14_0_20_35_14 TaxID=1974634 RepID=A0A2H0N763_9BACT|nr:MAG: tRNA pseudouridine(55) synthase TruB [Candidatus Liptonbacteria bacterium CG11_big_fil_rev_8_21_14_0_20_35_14]